MPSQPRAGRRVVVVLAVVAALCAGAVLLRGRTNVSPLVPAGLELDEHDENAPCSAARWPVKTLTDPAARTVDLHPTATTISTLSTLPRPPGIVANTPRLPAETATVTVPAALYAEHLELDRDIHLVIRDPGGNGQMIAELPDPSCTGAADPALRAPMTAARNAYLAACGPPSSAEGAYYVQASAQVTGVEFFDTFVGQFGRAPNAIELHPVTGFAITGACRKYSGTRTVVTSSMNEGSTVSGAVQWTATVQASRVSTLTFAVDNAVVESFGAGTSETITYDTSSLADGQHSFTVTATLPNGSTSILVNHVDTSNGVSRPTNPALALDRRRLRRGRPLTIRLRGFPPRAAVTVTAVHLGRRWASRSSHATAAGAGRLVLVVPKASPLGKYTITACSRGCGVVAARSVLVVR